MYDLMVTIKVCQDDIYDMYYDPISKFTIEFFWAFKVLLDYKHENI